MLQLVHCCCAVEDWWVQCKRGLAEGEQALWLPTASRQWQNIWPPHSTQLLLLLLVLTERIFSTKVVSALHFTLALLQRKLVRDLRIRELSDLERRSRGAKQEKGNRSLVRASCF